MNAAGLALALHLALQVSAPPDPSGYLYRATLLQAAPGKLVEVIELYKAGWPGLQDSGDAPPIAMRHSQGDRWDLMLLFPMGSWGSTTRRTGSRSGGGPGRRPRRTSRRFPRDVAWQEDVFVYGPPLPEVRGALEKAGFFHIEMFEALPGRERDLYRQREMENAYSARLGLPQNLIFVRDAGAPWSLFTIGAYRDLKHYAESADVPEAKSEEAARAAGFDGAKAIGPYLRTLIALHHDTLAVAIK